MCLIGHILWVSVYGNVKLIFLNAYTLTTKYQDTNINCHHIIVKSRGMSGEDHHYETSLSPCPNAHPLNLSLKRWEK
jgi:hypothetical protein